MPFINIRCSFKGWDSFLRHNIWYYFKKNFMEMKFTKYKTHHLRHFEVYNSIAFSFIYKCFPSPLVSTENRKFQCISSIPLAVTSNSILPHILTTISLLSDCIDLPTLDISHTWNYIVVAFFVWLLSHNMYLFEVYWCHSSHEYLIFLDTKRFVYPFNSWWTSGLLLLLFGYWD